MGSRVKIGGILGFRSAQGKGKNKAGESDLSRVYTLLFFSLRRADPQGARLS